MPDGEAYHAGVTVKITDGLPQIDEDHVRESLKTVLEKHDLKYKQISNTHIIVESN